MYGIDAYMYSSLVVSWRLGAAATRTGRSTSTASMLAGALHNMYLENYRSAWIADSFHDNYYSRRTDAQSFSHSSNQIQSKFIENLKYVWGLGPRGGGFGFPSSTYEYLLLLQSGCRVCLEYYVVVQH